MSQTLDDLKTHLHALPREDQVVLANFLMDCLERSEDSEWQSAWKNELDRRAESARTGQAKCRPAKEVLDELRRKLA